MYCDEILINATGSSDDRVSHVLFHEDGCLTGCTVFLNIVLSHSRMTDYKEHETSVRVH